ncbi:MAG: 1-acyl-sn-glycerol-3-phosphate acyltransferase [Bacteroidales bacterium]|nr:1-acyl-sn-glycerol-3-phosphate acyltransferase [Bacteroidales bacterium]
MKRICYLILKLFNFNVDLDHIPCEKKYVLVVAPHTSWADFALGKIALKAMNIKTTFLMKKELFFFPFGCYLKYLGGYPVDRRKASHLTDILAEYIKEKEEIAFLITPEGSRKRTETWKRGFYYIALKANVPIALGYLDFGTRKGGVGPVFYPTGDYEADFQIIKNFYSGMRGRRKGRFNLEISE